ncbi:hypothetical protein [Pseudomonas sp. Gutcm_11s]|uniref:hypothetical protein n=1 Tax=Pseudomonas sp. Gutcm_11s TaxID=3026088 RepID=UPI00236051A5|nr:hypothetical protein [Pseudomonas sp. Gutcm_11s]MDD0844009.1 hypothetical protein [Pseudomonas sp. Gutcm_11s]
MAIHYSTTPEQVACGRTGANLSSTSDATQVSCKLCLRSVEKPASEPVRKSPSLADLRAAAKAAKVVEAAPAAAQPASAKTARAEWQRRLEQLPGRSRLPRGMAK